MRNDRSRKRTSPRFDPEHRWHLVYVAGYGVAWAIVCWLVIAIVVIVVTKVFG